jgi:hypothetical protein
VPYVSPVGTCEECGKLKFTSRKLTRKYMHKRFPNQKFSVYRCGAYFHFGHTPWRVREGKKAR